MDIAAQQQRDNDVIDKEWDGPARPGKWTGWIGRKVEKGDRWSVLQFYKSIELT